jgi:hypothetical protein
LFAGRTHAPSVLRVAAADASSIPVTNNLMRVASQRLSMAGAVDALPSVVGLGAIEAHLSPTIVRLSAPFARAVWRGRFLVLAEDDPTTTLIFFIYGRVKRADDGFSATFCSCTASPISNGREHRSDTRRSRTRSSGAGFWRSAFPNPRRSARSRSSSCLAAGGRSPGNTRASLPQQSSDRPQSTRLLLRVSLRRGSSGFPL